MQDTEKHESADRDGQSKEPHNRVGALTAPVVFPSIAVTFSVARALTGEDFL